MKKSEKKIIEQASAILEKEEKKKKGNGLTNFVVICTMIALLGLTAYALLEVPEAEEEEDAE